MTEHTPGPIPPFPKALYGCQERGCAEEVSHFPEELWLITDLPNGWDPGWYCDECIGEVRFHNPDTRIGETLGHYLGLERSKVETLNAEMLAALKHATKTMEDYGWDLANMDAEGKESYKFVIDAISKAEGTECTTPK